AEHQNRFHNHTLKGYRVAAAVEMQRPQETTATARRSHVKKSPIRLTAASAAIGLLLAGCSSADGGGENSGANGSEAADNGATHERGEPDHGGADHESGEPDDDSGGHGSHSEDGGA